MKRIIRQDEKGRRYYQLDEDLKFNAMAYLPGPIPCTTTISIDMTEAIAWQKKLEKEKGTRVSLTCLIIKAAANILPDLSILCGKWESMDRIRCPDPEEIDINGPVQVGDMIGFFYISKANQKTLWEIAQELDSQVTEMKSGKGISWPEWGQIPPAFAISNIGTIGPAEEASGPVAWFATSILGIGAIMEKPAVKNGQIQIRNMMNATLSWDHRAMMANTAVEFLTQLKNSLEKPETYLV
jgi:pyruvate dehydrogenase E2 component (dihydrolipoamide acetyltransferase)